MAAESSLVLYLRGELDLDSTEQLSYVTTAVLDDSDAPVLELDLSDLTFIDMAAAAAALLSGEVERMLAALDERKILRLRSAWTGASPAPSTRSASTST